MPKNINNTKVTRKEKRNCQLIKKEHRNFSKMKFISKGKGEKSGYKKDDSKDINGMNPVSVRRSLFKKIF